MNRTTTSEDRAICKRCGQDKLRKFFHKDRKRPNGLYPYCKVCVGKYKAGHPEYVRSANQIRQQQPDYKHRRWARNLKAFGISEKEYEAQLEKQNYCCAICKTHISKLRKRLAVDHDHVTGEVRGLLCNVCNPSLGGFNDDITLLEAAIAYLRGH